jgi:hypothetical protein
LAAIEQRLASRFVWLPAIAWTRAGTALPRKATERFWLPTTNGVGDVELHRGPHLGAVL